MADEKKPDRSEHYQKTKGDQLERKIIESEEGGRRQVNNQPAQLPYYSEEAVQRPKDPKK